MINAAPRIFSSDLFGANYIVFTSMRSHLDNPSLGPYIQPGSLCLATKELESTSCAKKRDLKGADFVYNVRIIFRQLLPQKLGNSTHVFGNPHYLLDMMP